MKPLHERLGEIMKKKQEYLQSLRIKAEKEDKDLTFKPKLTEHVRIYFILVSQFRVRFLPMQRKKSVMLLRDS